ncbi:MAG TPA: hypothetical protein VLV83_21685 [Acidobacteriota bacterium]|nr:hypothetical protein [Acidobacteriota bacterium]
MKASHLVMFGLLAALTLVNAVVLVQPVYAMSCTVSCPNGEEITCPGSSCQRYEGYGCTYVDGGITVLIECDPV